MRNSIAALAFFLTGLLSAIIPQFTHAQDKIVAQLYSPDHALNLEVIRTNDGNLAYRVLHQSEELIGASRLGFILADAPKLDRRFEFLSSESSAKDQTWEQPWGENRKIRDNHKSLITWFHQPYYGGRKLGLEFRLFNDGLAFRYLFPDQDSLKTLKIVDELTEFAVTPLSEALWIEAGEWNRYEYLYNRTPLNQVSQAHTPITLKTNNGLYLSFHEGALIDYAAMWLRRVKGQRLKARLSPSPIGPSVVRGAPFNSPWRTIVIAKTVRELYGSNIVLNVNEPNKLGDTSYFKPHKYIGIWWEMHLNQATWEPGTRHGATTKRTKELIDFAAKHGFGSVLVEGWNTGWEDWFATGELFDYQTPTPDFDLKALSTYAAQKGLSLMGHHETGANIAVYERHLESGFALYQRNGIHSVKTGYVADAGGVQALDDDGQRIFAWHDGQIMTRHHLKVVETAHKYKIAVNPHEPVKDTGLRRTYPNWVSREGARGMEYNAWGSPPNPPEHEVNLTYTRLLSGPMDYTPGILSLEGAGQRLQSTLARQLALYIVLYSPIQMAADLPENYVKYPKAFQFIKNVAVDWESSQLVDGEIGDYAAFVRKDRHSEDWYYGAITDETPRILSLKLDFLVPGQTYRAEIYRDGHKADALGPDRHDIIIEKKTLSHKDDLSFHLARGGGVAVRFVPIKNK
jgi:alpha-glucosidase